MPVDCGVDPDFQDMVRGFFGRDLAQRGPGEAADGFDAEAWGQLEEMGLTLLTADEARGGSGASWAEAATLLHALGHYGIAVPYAEHDLLAAWLTERLGLPEITGPTSLALVDAAAGAGDVVLVPCTDAVERLLVVRAGEAGGSVQDLPAGSFEIVDTELAGAEPRSRVRVSAAAEPVAIDAAAVRELQLRGALARSLQLLGALDRCVSEAVAHATTRVQFGRPLTRFQAVQALLAEAAAEAAMAGAATEAAVVAWIEAGEATAEVECAVAVAKSCVSHAVEPVTRNAHQVLGAMGTTLEHDLHRYTLPSLHWRNDFGSARHWDLRIARDAIGRGDGLWARLAPLA